MDKFEVYQKQAGWIKYRTDISKNENKANRKNTDEIKFWKSEMLAVKSLHILKK